MVVSQKDLQFILCVSCLVLRCDGSEDFANFARLNGSCLTAYYLVAIRINHSLYQCYKFCETERCASFTHDHFQNVCFVSTRNSNTARQEFRQCSQSIHNRNTSYFERLPPYSPDSFSCRFPFLWNNTLHHECSRNASGLVCSVDNGIGEKASFANCPLCFPPTTPKRYRGLVNSTVSGKSCLNWKYSAYNWREPELGLGDHNYCRSPDNDVNGVWCYTGVKSYEYCNVMRCDEGPKESFTTRLDSCGTNRLDNKYRKIIGGRGTDWKTIPWQVALVHKRSKIIDCGGSMVSSRYVVTAAHCFKKSAFSHYSIVAPYNDIAEQELPIEDVIFHPLYRKRLLDNDIALIKLAGDIKVIGSYALPACLPSSPNQFSTTDKCIVSGFERNYLGDSIRLEYAEVPLLSFHECKKDTLLGPKLTRNMQCAGYYNKPTDSCKGDSGSPLVCLDSENKLYLWGIVSWGDDCGKRPGIYTKVVRYINWIRCVISGEISICK